MFEKKPQIKRFNCEKYVAMDVIHVYRVANVLEREQKKKVMSQGRQKDEENGCDAVEML